MKTVVALLPVARSMKPHPLPSGRVLFTGLVAGCLLFAAFGSAAQGLRNWFGDPFFRVTSAIAGCPEPAGPRVTEEERGEQAHRRAEKGTTCWLARETDCERSSAYAYDKDIEAEISEVFAKTRELPRSSLWVTVQGRVVYVEGCVVENSEAAAIERLIRPLPHIQQVVAIVATPPFSKPSYKVYEAR